MKLGRVGVVIAARMLSSRLPGKALLPLQGLPMIVFLLHRLAGLERASVVLATTTLPADDRLAEAVGETGTPIFRGADADVVGRYCSAAEAFRFDTIVRITGDCPFVDAELVDWCLDRAAALDPCDLATTKGHFPIGLDAEIYSAPVMAQLNVSGKLTAEDREHLTLHFYRNSGFAVRAIEPPIDWRPNGRIFTVDTSADYDAAVALAARFRSPDFSISALMAKAAA